MNRKLVAGLGVAMVIAALAVIGVTAPTATGSTTHLLTVSFPSADGLVGGSDVLEAGAKIGFIKDIAPQADNTALVTLVITDDHWPLHDGLKADIRPKSLLGEKYVDLHDGSATAVYDARKTVVASATAVPVELDQFINSLDPSTRVAAQTLLDDLGAGVAGRGQDLNTAIATGRANLDHLAVTGQTLDNRDPELDRILVSLDGLLGKITTDDQLNQLSQLIGNGQATLNTIESEQATFSRSFTDAAVTLSDLNVALGSAVPSLHTTLDIAPQLLGNLTTEADLLTYVAGQVNNPQVLASITSGVVHGPTTTGGALEVHPDGTKLPIFRICLISPSPGSCTGSGSFSGQQSTALPASSNGGSQMSSFANWMAS